jgi:hypothetical protein
MREIAITVCEATEGGGYMYDVYDTAEYTEGCDPVDGGLCDGTLRHAVTMACATAQAYIRKNEPCKHDGHYMAGFACTHCGAEGVNPIQ